jgi:predicted nucleotidyltransferase
MPIDIERFESAEGPDEPTTGERIIRFLLEHDDRAYTRGEIAAAIDVNPETVGTNLTRLKARDLVRHREPYWAFTDDHEQARTILRERGADDLVALLSESARDGSHGVDRGAQKASTESDSGRPHRLAASAFTDRVRDQLGEAIDACYVFGSVARRTETATSDVDILAVIADEADFREADDRLLDIAFDVQLEYDVPIEVHSLRTSEFEAHRGRGEPFVRRIVEEGASQI